MGLCVCLCVCVIRYGLGPMRRDARTKFKATLTRYKDTNAYCNMFGRLWGLFDPLDEPWCDYYLEWMTLLIEARSAKDEAVIPVKHGLSYMVRRVCVSLLCWFGFGKSGVVCACV